MPEPLNVLVLLQSADWIPLFKTNNQASDYLIYLIIKRRRIAVNISVSLCRKSQKLLAKAAFSIRFQCTFTF